MENRAQLWIAVDNSAPGESAVDNPVDNFCAIFLIPVDNFSDIEHDFVKFGGLWIKLSTQTFFSCGISGFKSAIPLELSTPCG